MANEAGTSLSGTTGTSGDDNTQNPPPAETKPKTGEVTADENKRFLSELVVCHALSRLGEKIADTLAGVHGGGILIVDDLSFAANDVFRVDIRNKLDVLLKWTKDTSDKCQASLEAEEEEKPREAWISPIAEVSQALAIIGDIVGYFRSDYVVKGQSFEDVDDLYIQALVAEKLRQKKKDVYLLNFHFVSQSKLLQDLSELLKRKHNLLTCAGMLKSKIVAPEEAQIQALAAHLASLRAKLIEYLVEVDDEAFADLRTEIDKIAGELKDSQKSRIPDSQFAALETYLSNLRSKLVDELVKNAAEARKAIEQEIGAIIKQLEDNEKANQSNKLSATKVKALNDQLKILQSRLAELLAATNENAKKTLRQEIDNIGKLLAGYQENRVPDSQVAALETHLAGLRAKLVECLTKKDSVAKANLKAEIEEVVRRIEEKQKRLANAKGIVDHSVEVDNAINAFVSNITTVPSGGTYPPLVDACIREHFAEGRIDYMLKLKLVSARADFVVEKPPILWWRVNTYYYGGGVVSYVMVDKDGKIAASGTVSDGAAAIHRLGREQPRLLNWEIHNIEVKGTHSVNPADTGAGIQ